MKTWNPETISLCETVYQLTRCWTFAEIVPQNSADQQDLTVQWAIEFEELHAGREWDGEWFEFCDRHFDHKYQQWRSAATDTEENWIKSPYAAKKGITIT